MKYIIIGVLNLIDYALTVYRQMVFAAKKPEPYRFGAYGMM